MTLIIKSVTLLRITASLYGHLEKPQHPDPAKNRESTRLEVRSDPTLLRMVFGGGKQGDKFNGDLKN